MSQLVGGQDMAWVTLSMLSSEEQTFYVFAWMGSIQSTLLISSSYLDIVSEEGFLFFLE